MQMQPAAHGKLDPAVLASLPPSMQLDLLVQVSWNFIADGEEFVCNFLAHTNS